MAVEKNGMLLGMGNPLLDISAEVTEELLKKYELEANNAILAEDKHQPLYKEICDNFNAEFIPGGATQNSMRVAQWILQEPESCSYIGCVGKDNYSETMTSKCKEENLKTAYMVDEETPTGTCAVLITGQHRSLVANLSAANNYKISHIENPENWAIVEKARCIYSAGFFLTVSVDTILKVAKHCAENNKIFCMNISAPFLTQFFKEQMLSVAPYWDVIFGNETEAAAFAENNGYETKDIKEIAMKLAEHEKKNTQRSRLVVFTQGSDPTIVCQDGKITEYKIQPLKAEEIVDTNAAGDAFVGGFLAKYVEGKPMEECVECGHWAARTIIQQSGCTFPSKTPVGLTK